jgi:putative sigma-54 modulation protein
MDVIIHGQNIKITDQLKAFTQEKLGKLDRYLPNITEVRVDLTRQNIRRGGHQTSAQITLKHARGAILRAEERITGDNGDDVKAVIQRANEKLSRQIERFKGKQSKRRRSADEFERFAATAEELAMAEDFSLEPVVEVEGNEEILRHKSVSLTPMNEQEAVEQMELLGHDFFMFMNAETGEVNVLYRRSSEGYGVLIPQE